MRVTPIYLLTAAVLLFGQSCSKKSNTTTFATPDEAAKALMQALQTNDTAQMEALFGRETLQAVASGDPASDRHDREVIGLAMEQSWRWTPLGSDRKELIIGDEQWPFPVPLASFENRWRFDSEAGKDEVVARRIGRNELGVIDLCRAYVDWQNEYAAAPHDGKKPGLYAQRLHSTSGRRDGLYWETKAGEPPSPLGDLAARAADEGYSTNKAEGSPFWGYRFRILTAQGASAPGGEKSYLNNGDLGGGFALVAYPAKYGSSGVMTFVVNQDGAVYQQDLGAETSQTAAKIAKYDPGPGWQLVPAPKLQ